jgi:UDP-N-acetylglucosamine 1-carboxyvinyltransferase
MRLGADISINHGYIEARAGRLRGTEYCFNKPTVTGTENLMMAATLARGRTILQNCALEPEITDLAELLNAMGAEIRGHGTGRIVIDGVEALKGTDHRVIPDRIETGTFMIAAAMTGGHIRLLHSKPRTLTSVIDKLSETGVEITRGEDTIEVKMNGSIEASDVETLPYPGFPTDMQAQYMSLMTQSTGVSVIKENIFENRFMHVAELKRMGARIDISGRTAMVRGGPGLSGAGVMATDLRASASLILAGLVAEGETVVDRIYHIDRGYARIEEKLQGLGAQIERIES